MCVANVYRNFSVSYLLKLDVSDRRIRSTLNVHRLAISADRMLSESMSQTDRARLIHRERSPFPWVFRRLRLAAIRANRERMKDRESIRPLPLSLTINHRGIEIFYPTPGFQFKRTQPRTRSRLYVNLMIIT